jgi:hypothetical protein
MGYLLTTQKQYQQVKKLTFSGTGGEAPPAASARTNKDFYANYATESLALSDLANGIILRVEASLAGAYTIVIFGHTQKGEMEQLFSFTATCAATNTVSDDGNYIAQTVAVVASSGPLDGSVDIYDGAATGAPGLIRLDGIGYEHITAIVDVTPDGTSAEVIVKARTY